jgi:hypothetical protein
MKQLLWVLFCLILISLGYGLYHKTYVEFAQGERIIGFSVLAGTFLYLPLFLYHRWKGKQLKDYTLSEENLKKMRGED